MKKKKLKKIEIPKREMKIKLSKQEQRKLTILALDRGETPNDYLKELIAVDWDSITAKNGKFLSNNMC